MNYSRDKIEPTSFADDVEKMRDFALLSKEEFLRSYSYLTEEEYDLTAADILQQAASLKTFPSVGEAEKRFYRVAITETYVREVNIYAEDSAAAEELADELCSEDKIAIDYDHFAHRKAECQGISRTSDLELLECYGFEDGVTEQYHNEVFTVDFTGVLFQDDHAGPGSRGGVRSTGADETPEVHRAGDAVPGHRKEARPGSVCGEGSALCTGA